MERISDHRPAADVYPIAQNGRVEMLSGVGSFTSACGITVYLGGAFPPSLGLFSLVAEPAQSLVHRDILTPDRATHVARRAREGVEFLASTDPWFRPVNFYVGPDGAIYLVDYYRLMVEHPEWTATHTHHSPDLYKGEDRGRIYRISPEAAVAASRQDPARPGINGAVGATAGQPEHLVAPHGATLARRSRKRRRGGAADDDCSRRSQSSVARLHALWTLDGLNRLEARHIEQALDDPEAGVRENAILLAEPRLQGPTPRLSRSS